MAFTLQFVASIVSSPSVRLNLNSAPNGVPAPATPWVAQAGTDFGSPEMRYATASTLLTDGERLTASAPGNRVLTLRLYVDAGSVDATATEIQKLARELNRPTNLLMTQLGTSPVFFRTYRCAPSDWLVITDGTRATVTAAIPAKPYAEGLTETAVTGTLDTNPANANGHFLDTATIKGDVMTPAVIRWPATAIAVNRETLFAVRQHGTPSAGPFLFQAEDQTNGTDTTDQANASFSGAGGGTRTTFATASMQTRNTISDLGTASVDLRGRYKVYARYAKTTSGDTITCQIVWGTSGGTTTTNDSVVLPSGTTIQMMYLGEIQVPRGWDSVTHPLTGAEIAASDTFHLAFQASRSGAGNLDLDYFILVPADEKFGIVKWVEAGPSYWLLDAESGASTAFNASDQVATAAEPGGPTGGLPWLAPNQVNRLYMVYEVASGLTTTLTTISVTVTYNPRYLMPRPAST